jgi:hypothetical protein
MQLCCGICGKDADKDILRDTFTDLDSLKSHVFCEDCSTLFDGEFLKTSFYITEKEKRAIKQNELYDLIFLTASFPCKISFSKSRKKHRLFRTKWSPDEATIIVSTDDGDILLSRKKDKEIAEYLLYLYNEKQSSKSDILQGFTTSQSLKRIGIDEYLRYKKKVGKLIKTKKLELLVDIINKHEQ